MDAAEYNRLSQYQRLRLLIREWRTSTAPDKCIQLAALWDLDDLEQDWLSVPDWWHPRQWYRWHWGVWQCQNFHRISLGPVTILFAT